MNKNLIIGLAMIIGVIFLGYKLTSGPSSSFASNGSTLVNMTTNPDPIRVGSDSFVFDVKDNSGKPVDNATILFDINMTTMNMGTQQGSAVSQGNGKYTATGNISMQGPWRVGTKVTMPDGKVISKDFTIEVQ